jgi:hypothetical protein
MNAAQITAFIEHKIEWMTGKKADEASYLKRRPHKEHTRTNKRYHTDQIEEFEMLAFLEHFKKTLEDI